MQFMMRLTSITFPTAMLSGLGWCISLLRWQTKPYAKKANQAKLTNHTLLTYCGQLEQ
ncbi:hypothetical protein [Alteromonas sp. a30]|uniref:hypothetical protein n=1 Tax=Alteromonas sp. a30 TaxID=2730917 RepID=UPI00228269E8|nr:hypothetical protein [Alteromonas sp. a30]MCY7294861.1 hypothetical protein [Alteromonas sp. a30]